MSNSRSNNSSSYSYNNRYSYKNSNRYGYKNKYSYKNSNRSDPNPIPYVGKPPVGIRTPR
jgi:hypothetical protein